MEKLKEIVRETVNELEEKQEEELTKEDMEWLDYKYEHESNRWENYF